MKAFRKKLCIIILLLAAAIIPLTGCTTKSNVPPLEEGMSSVSTLAGDIKDIEVPPDLKWDRDKSMTIKTESFNGGIWQYSGRVDVLSLKDYLISSMHNNGWKHVGESTARDILLAFVKPDKTCMMVLSESRVLRGSTTLTLYVTVDRTAAASLNPFGEVVR
ncbi:MAG: hypothetical protein SCH71_13915 [Desulfobulbaceae bacterium]|nr:hypothetical protein [Desulfobulbaceae bacterium]